MSKKNKIAIAHCVHHKPWLIMSTLISTAIQDFQDFDIFFLYNKGSGEIHYDRYKQFYAEYDTIKKTFGKNSHLDGTFDEKLLEVCKIKRNNIYEISYEDDHGLDSGAWYKFIKSGLWKNYEYVFFMGEGALLTSPSVLGDTIQFAKENEVHFITGSNHKRFISRSWLLNGFVSQDNPTELTLFNDRMINETFSVFCRDPEFKRVMQLWKYKADSRNTYQEHHIPDIWGKYGFFIEKVMAKLERRFSFLRSIHNYYLRLFNSMFIQLKNFGLITLFEKKKGIDKICRNMRMTKLSEVVDYEKCGNTNFHKSKEIGWFGTHCNHFVSTALLEKLSSKLDRYQIYDAMKLPYAAGPLEPIWGLIPAWLGYEIWFFDGIHRVFKNFLNYIREDNKEGMARYLNYHYRGKLCIGYDEKNVKIKSCYKSYKKRLSVLNEIYF